MYGNDGNGAGTHKLLSEFIDPEMEISTPFLARLGQVPIVIYAILERTAVYQIIGEDGRRVARHDLIFAEEKRIRTRPVDAIKLAKKEANARGRENARLNKLLAKEIG